MKYGIKLALLMLLASIAFGPTADARTGFVRVVFTKAALLAGAGAGHGVLTFDGRDHPFSVTGLSVGLAAGASVSRLTGRASYLHELRDFEGIYESVGVGGALVGGAGGVQLKNEKGVIITLQGVRAGVEFGANLSGVRIAFE
jgi:hypothetical protein